MKQSNTSDGKEIGLRHIPAHLMDQVPADAEMQDSTLPVAQYRRNGVWCVNVEYKNFYFETEASAECFIEDTWDVE